MKRTTLSASLVGSAAAGLIAAAVATPAWAQATTYPEGTDCSAIQNSTSRQDCMSQMNESRQTTTPSQTVPDANAAPGTATGTGGTGGAGALGTGGGAAGAAPATGGATGTGTGTGTGGTTGGAGGAAGGGATP